jgi:hypothetical protein
MKAKGGNGVGVGRGVHNVRVVAKANLPTQYGRTFRTAKSTNFPFPN